MVQDNDSISFQFIDEEIHMDLNNPNFEIRAKLSNTSDQGFILYAFRRTSVVVTSFDSIFFTTIHNLNGAGNGIFVLNKDGERQLIEINDCDDCQEVDKNVYKRDYLEIAREEIKDVYLKNTEVLCKEEKDIILKVTFGPNQLKRGQYLFYMIYYCGNEIEEIVGDSSNKFESTKCRAITFKGLLKSNNVKLIVE
jgi:hypothetical protein